MTHEDRPNDTPRPKRPAPISWRPPAGKRAVFEARVAESGLTPNAFFTEAVFGRSRHRPAEIRLLAQILAECAACADRLREIELAGGAGATLEIEAAREDLAEIRSALFLLMGRQP